jgi:hypothetical protein
MWIRDTRCHTIPHANLTRDLAPLPTKLPPSCYCIEASRANSLLGGWAPATTAGIEAIPQAEAPSEVATTAVAEPQSRLPITSYQWSVSTVVSVQNGFLSSPRIHRKKPFKVWWSMEWVLALLIVGHGDAPKLCFIGAEEQRRKCCCRPYLDECSRLDHGKMVHGV